jgi:putative FmdB family regulatory protein
MHGALTARLEKKMPIYDYRCRRCGRVHEVFVQRPDAASGRCPSCGADDLEKLLSSFNVVSEAARAGGTTCCGREERCEAPPCSADDVCRRR